MFTAYVNLAKSFANQLAGIGKPVEDDELIGHIVCGFNPQFTPFITAYTVATRDANLC